MRKTLVLTALGALMSLPLRPAEAVTATQPLEFQPCRLEHPQRLTAVAAECARFAVREDPADPTSRVVQLHVARVAAISRRKLPDPLFVLAGGPGMAATTFYAMVAPVFARIHRDRDIVLVDQRGTGGSNPLNCVAGDDTFASPTDAQIAADTQRCLQELSKTANVAFYTTSIAVQDLDRVRAAMGYERINLYGDSYGTRVAQHYLRRFPKHTRTVILDGVVPPQLALGPTTALDAEQALQRLLARCVSEPACHSAFGDPAQAYRTLWDSLQRQSVPVSLADPGTGKNVRFEFGPYHLATVLRFSTYTAEQAALLPLLLHDAQQSRDFSRLAAQLLLLNRSYGGLIASGMNNTVACAEDIPFYQSHRIDRARLQQTFLGTTQLDALQMVCKSWPRGPIDSDFHTPLHSDVPVLLLSGDEDPVTPPAYAQEGRRGLSNSAHLVLKGFHHGQLAVACMDRVMERFVTSGAVSGLDTSCTQAARPLPFFTSVNGPQP